MNFLRTYLTIGSVYAAIRIVCAMIIVFQERHKGIDIDKLSEKTCDLIFNRPFMHSLNCMTSIVLWPVELVLGVVSIVRWVTLSRKKKKLYDKIQKDIEEIHKIFDENDWWK